MILKSLIYEWFESRLCMSEYLWQCKAGFQRKIQLIGVIADSCVVSKYILHYLFTATMHAVFIGKSAKFDFPILVIFKLCTGCFCRPEKVEELVLKLRKVSVSLKLILLWFSCSDRLDSIPYFPSCVVH